MSASYLLSFKVLFSSHLSWVIFLSMCSLMLFPIWEGEFLNFDCSVSPFKEGEIKNFDRILYKVPSLARGPSPQGMANDRCISDVRNVNKWGVTDFVLERTAAIILYMLQLSPFLCIILIAE